MDNQNIWNALNLLNVYSVYLALENLQENRLQAEQNDVNAANDKQAQFLLEQIGKRLDAQDKMLEEIMRLVKEK